MYRHLTVILLFILLSGLVHGQKTIVGKVLNKTTHAPIPFANIGVVNSNVGTISNMDGSFSILLPQRLNRDTLIFTSLGFFKQGLAVSSLESKKDYTIYLNERVTLLQSVIITAKKIKDKDIDVGNRTYYGGNYEPDTTYAGRAVALLIDSKNFPEGTSFPVYVKKAKLLILRNNFQSFKFRVRINKYDSLTGKPGEDLLEKSIVEESDMKSGWLIFDLTKAYFRAKGPFFITFEQLVDLNGRTVIALGYREIMTLHPDWLKTDTVLIDNKKVITREFIPGRSDLPGTVSIPGTFIGISNSKSAIQKYTCFIRQTSLGEWTKVPFVIAATVTVSGQFGETPDQTKELPVLEIR
jgi:hypothetical protein